MEKIPKVQFSHDLVEVYSHNSCMGKHLLGLFFLFEILLANGAYGQIYCRHILQDEGNLIQVKIGELVELMQREPKLKDVEMANPEAFKKYISMIFSALYEPVPSRAEIGNFLQSDPIFQRNEGLEQLDLEGTVEHFYSQKVDQKVRELMFSVQNQFAFLKYLKNFEAKNEDVLVESLYGFFISELKRTNAQVPRDAPPETRKTLANQVDLLMFELGEVTIH